ncbi:anthranilate/aminodeoxychorismate synthase component II [Candidatus Roizmanbacteria bacterium CG_4_10_14_0_2_um_filter_39_13]|uniref:Anthranilate/aminodeoxychorismate synthase component II n=1 Tax=Candidatus Roizmanbacteria bacterium CG_4_10_14_0_2_um_filter_39_13 TaxID=1974825 RepID=A0A2M7U0S1_9BACT|nr:MAG: anthranilate/aminodeoxychorismate synthase component II [Candidatus Roizmanbacteria bacterium CG_4_10_14_0_2_um_filter_39_13]
MKILIIDNYDSFTFNLYQFAGEILLEEKLVPNITVKRNDEINLSQIQKESYDHVIISPGPGDPSDAAYFGVCADVILKIGKTIPVLGVCLGMQGIGHYFGGKIVKATTPMHGKTSCIFHDEKGVFKGLSQRLEVMRYHSLVVDRKTIPSCLEITATSQVTDEIMGLRHKSYPIEGVQFHPESIFTESGKQLLRNFLL